MLNTEWIAKEQLRFLSAYFNDFSIIFCLANVKLSGEMNSDLKYIRINKSEQHVFQSTYILCFSLESDQKVIALYSQKLSQVIQASSCLFLGMGREVNLSLCLNFQWMGNTQYTTLHVAIRTFTVSSNHWFTFTETVFVLQIYGMIIYLIMQLKVPFQCAPFDFPLISSTNSERKRSMLKVASIKLSFYIKDQYSLFSL